MTRKTYYRKGMQLVVAVNKQLGLDVGKGLRNFREKHREAPSQWGSYEKAWNSNDMRMIRRIYLKENC